MNKINHFPKQPLQYFPLNDPTWNDIDESAAKNFAFEIINKFHAP